MCQAPGQIFIDITHAQIQISWLVSFPNPRKLKLEQSLGNTLFSVLLHFLVWFGFLSLHEKKIKIFLTFQKVAGLTECTSQPQSLGPPSVIFLKPGYSLIHPYFPFQLLFPPTDQVVSARKQNRGQQIPISAFQLSECLLKGKHQENPQQQATSCKNWEQKAEQKDLKNLQFDMKRSTFKVGARKVQLSKRLVPLKKNHILCTETTGKDDF